MPHLTVQSPVGPLSLVEEDGRLTRLDWRAAEGGKETPLLVEARAQLSAYFAGKLRRFDLPLGLAGSPHQQQVWQAMQRIPFGQTRSYGEVASELGSGPRAVGTACGRNPIAIVVPCHRILGSGRTIGGYSGGAGLATKRFLLALEGATIAGREGLSPWQRNATPMAGAAAATAS
jgi:methylated-DNA-[protein]-cysteine S-methyltransferase